MKKNLFILLTLFIAYLYSTSVLDYFLRQIYTTTCFPLFIHPLWVLANALYASTFAILLIKVFRIKYTLLELLLLINLYFLIKGFITFINIYGFDYAWFFEAVFSEYVKKDTLLFSLNFLTLGFLFMEE
jgi:hypothetical protein